MNAIQLSGVNTERILSSLIFNEFHKDGDDLLPHQITEKHELIQTAEQYGLYDLANELKKDIQL